MLHNKKAPCFLGAVLPWVVSLVSQEGSMCARDEKRHQEGGELQHVEKGQTKGWEKVTN